MDIDLTQFGFEMNEMQLFENDTLNIESKNVG